MHNAPAVSCPVGRSVWYTTVLCVLVLAGLCSTLLAVHQAQHWQARHTGLLLVWLVSSAIAGMHWLRCTTGRLYWDGAAWQLDEQAGQVHVALDIQRCLLLRWVPGEGATRAGARWLWLDKGMCQERWMDLRRAVYSPRTTDSTHPF